MTAREIARDVELFQRQLASSGLASGPSSPARGAPAPPPPSSACELRDRHLGDAARGRARRRRGRGRGRRGGRRGARGALGRGARAARRRAARRRAARASTTRSTRRRARSRSAATARRAARATSPTSARARARAAEAAGGAGDDDDGGGAPGPMPDHARGARDPVVCSDGHTYERSAIEQRLRGHETSPLTNGASRGASSRRTARSRRPSTSGGREPAPPRRTAARKAARVGARGALLVYISARHSQRDFDVLIGKAAIGLR